MYIGVSDRSYNKNHKCITGSHIHLQSFATPPPRVAVRRREVIRHADGRGWEKMENVEFRNFLSITSRKSYCISKIIIFETVSRWLTCDYSRRNNTMSHLLPVVIWWPSSLCICRCLLIGGKLNSIKFLWSYLMSWIKVNGAYLCAMLICGTIWILRTFTTQNKNLFQFFVCCAAEVKLSAGWNLCIGTTVTK